MHLWFTAGILFQHLVRIKHNIGSDDKYFHINNGQQDFMYVKAVTIIWSLSLNSLRSLTLLWSTLIVSQVSFE